MGAYKKEVVFTIVMSLVFLLAGHMGFLFTLFPVEGMLFGFPIMYIVPVLMGWFGIVILTIIAGKMGNHIDKAIEREDQENQRLLQETKNMESKKGVI